MRKRKYDKGEYVRKRKDRSDYVMNEILKLKNQGKKNTEISKILGIADNTVSYYLKKHGYKNKKIKCKCENDFCGREFEIMEYNYRPEYHKKCRICHLYEKYCPVCGKKHNKQGLTCSSKCAWEIKKVSYLKSCGTEHNFSKNSKSRKEWETEMFLNSGITNIFQKTEIKDKIKKTCINKYGVDHFTKSDNYLEFIRNRLSENGICVPFSELNDYQVYRYNVMAFTSYNLKIYGNEKFGDKWTELIGVSKYHVDHIFSIRLGYEHKIPPYIIGNIVNLEIKYYKDNINKSIRCDISKEELYEKYDDFFVNNSKELNRMKEYREKFIKMKEKYGKRYIKMKNENS